MKVMAPTMTMTFYKGRRFATAVGFGCLATSDPHGNRGQPILREV